MFPFAPKINLPVMLLFVALSVGSRAQESAETPPSSGPGFTDLVLQGYAHEEKKDYQAAVASYSQALELREQSVTVLIRRAYAQVQLGRFVEAGQDLKEATYDTPVSMTDYTSLAWLKATCPFDVIRDGVLAVAHARKAIKERESAETFDILGAAYAEMNDFTRARDAVLEGLKRFPDSPRAPAMRERLALYQQKKPFRETWLAGGDDNADKALRRSF